MSKENDHETDKTNNELYYRFIHEEWNSTDAQFENEFSKWTKFNETYPNISCDHCNRVVRQWRASEIPQEIMNRMKTYDGIGYFRERPDIVRDELTQTDAVEICILTLASHLLKQDRYWHLIEFYWFRSDPN